MVHGGRWRGAPGRHAGNHSGIPLRLSHGFALDLDGIGVIGLYGHRWHQPGSGRTGSRATRWCHTGNRDGGGHLVSGLYQFQYIPGLCLLEGVEQPLVQNKQLLFPELFHVIPVGSVSPGHRDLHQQIRKADIPDGVKLRLAAMPRAQAR